MSVTPSASATVTAQPSLSATSTRTATSTSTATGTTTSTGTGTISAGASASNTPSNTPSSSPSPSTPPLATYVFSRDFVNVRATPARAALLYVHEPPSSGVLTALPTSGSALTTPFRISTGGWADDFGSAESSLAGAPCNTTCWLAQAWAVASLPQPSSVTAVAAYAASAPGGFDSTASSTVQPACAAAYSGSAAPEALPAWAYAQVAAGAALGVGADSVCYAVENGGTAALVAQAASRRAIPALQVPASGAFTYAFRINTNDTGVGAAALAASLDPLSTGGSAASLAAWARAEAGVYDSTSWAGTPLAAPGVATALSAVTLPYPDGVTVFSSGNLTLYVFVRAWTGAVALAYAPVRIVAALDTTASASAIASFATGAITSALANTTVTDNPYAAISTITAISSVLTVSYAATTATAANGTAANVTAALAAQNQAIADSLSSFLLTAVTAIVTTPSASNATRNATTLTGAALAAAKADTTIKVDNGLLTTIVGGASAIVGTTGTVSDATRTNVSSAMAATFLAAVPANAAFLDTPASTSSSGNGTTTNATASSTSSGASATKSNVAPIPPVVLSSALSTLATMAASVPVSNSTGDTTVTFVGGGGASAGGGSNTTATGASTPPPATAQDSQFAAQNTVITAIVAAMQRTCISPPCDVQAAASIPPGAADDAPDSPGRRLWDNAVAVTAALRARDAAAAAAAVAVAAAAAGAGSVRLLAASNDTAATLKSYCGPSLSLVTTRVTTAALAGKSQTLPVTAAVRPCFSAGSQAAYAATVSGGGSSLTTTTGKPSVTLSPAFLASAVPSGVAVDVTIVQNGQAPVSQFSGFAGYRFPATCSGSVPSDTGAVTLVNGSVLLSASRRLARAGAVDSLDVDSAMSLSSSPSPSAVARSFFRRLFAPSPAASAPSAAGAPSFSSSIDSGSRSRLARRAATTTTTSSTASATDAILALSASTGISRCSATSVADLAPATGLDSRVTQISLQSRAGAAVPVTAAAAPIVFTIPRVDPVAGSGAALVAAAYAQTAYTFACPPASFVPAPGAPALVTAYAGNPASATAAAPLLSAVSASGAGSTALVWANGVDRSSTLRLTHTSLPIVWSTAVSYTAYVSARQPSTCRLPLSSCDASGAVKSSVSLTTVVSQAAAAYADATTGGTAVVSSPVFVLTAPCAEPVGPRNVTCGPGAYGNVTTFVCPSITPVPLCSYWDETRRRWSTDGCAVFNVTAGAVTCACTHLTAFAARFAAVASDNRDIFAQTTRLGAADYGRALLMIGIVGGVLAYLAYALLYACCEDLRGDARFYAALVEDDELHFLGRIERAKGRPFVLDRLIDTSADTFKTRQMVSAMSSRRMVVAGGAGKGKAGVDDAVHSSAAASASTADDARRPARAAGRRSLASRLGCSRDLLLVSLLEPDDSLQARREALAGHYSALARLRAEGTPASLAEAKVLAEMIAVTDIESSTRTTRKTNPYAAALYIRVVGAFDALRVTADKAGELGSAGASAMRFMVEEEEGDDAVALKVGSGGAAGGETKAGTTRVPSAGRSRAFARTRIAISPASTPVDGSTSSGGAAASASSDKSGAASGFGSDALGGPGKSTARAGESGGNPSELRRAAILRSARAKMAVLDFAGASSCARAWRLRNFIARLSLLRITYTHPYFSIFTRYDVNNPRTLRLLLLASVLLGNLFVTAFFYAFRSGAGTSKDLPPLQLSETIVLSLIMVAMQQPITAVLSALLTTAGKANFRHRYPYVHAELARRKAAEARLAKMTTRELDAEFAALRRDEAALRASAAKNAGAGSSSFLAGAAAAGLLSSDAADRATAAAATAASAVPGGELGAGGADAGAAKSDAVSPAAAAAAATAEEIHFGWVDPPPALLRGLFWPLVVRLVGRHTDQKTAFLAAARAAETERVAKHEADLALRRDEAEAEALEREVAALEGGGGEGGASSSPGAASLSAVTAAAGAASLAGPFGQHFDPLNEAIESALFPGSSPSGFGAPVASGARGGFVSVLVSYAVSIFCFACARATASTAMATARAARRHSHWVGDARARKERALAKLERLRAGGGERRRSSSRGRASVTAADGAAPGKPAGGALRAARLSAEEEAALAARADVERSSQGINRGACGDKLPYSCTIASTIAVSATWVWIAFSLFYLFLFGLYQPKPATESFVYAWALNQAIGLFAVQPTVEVLKNVVALAILPAWLPWVIWVPGLGPAVAGSVAAATATGTGATALSGRLEHLTLIRAAGAASLLPPESAVLAFGVAAVVSSAAASTAELVARGAAAAAGEDSAATSAFAELSAIARSELTVKRYLLAQLRAVELSRLRRDALRRATTKLLALGGARAGGIAGLVGKAGKKKLADAAAAAASAASAAAAAAEAGAADAQPPPSSSSSAAAAAATATAADVGSGSYATSAGAENGAAASASASASAAAARAHAAAAEAELARLRAALGGGRAGGDTPTGAA